jgi:hypothetical protein
MIDAEQAKAIVLSKCEGWSRSGERFAVHSCVLSERGDYWIIRVNSEDFVLRGIQERQYIGVGAHLVNTSSGEVEVIGSRQDVQQHLNDQYDLAAAGDGYYVLVCAIDAKDKAAIVHLKKRLGCTLTRAVHLTSAGSRDWLVGKRSSLLHAQALLEREGISVIIELKQGAGSAERIDYPFAHWDALKSALSGPGAT